MGRETVWFVILNGFQQKWKIQKSQPTNSMNEYDQRDSTKKKNENKNDILNNEI